MPLKEVIIFYVVKDIFVWSGNPFELSQAQEELRVDTISTRDFLGIFFYFFNEYLIISDIRKKLLQLDKF